MYKFSANLGLLWTEMSQIDAIYKAKDKGFDAVEFQFPYQGKYLSEKQNHFGFNRLFFKDPPKYSYVPIFDMNVISGKILLKELINRVKQKLGFK